MLNAEAVEIWTDETGEGSVVVRVSEFEGFNAVEFRLSTNMMVGLEAQLKRCINVLRIDRRRVRPEISEILIR